MPWLIRKRNDKFCVYKKGSDGKPTGKTLGCHKTKEGAKKHLAALYVNVSDAQRNIKALTGDDEWTLDVLGNPWYGPNGGRDTQGEYFAPDTKFHEDKFGLPPAVYYHGLDDAGRPAGEPQYIGRTIKRWVNDAGVWYRVALDKTNALARRVWEAAKRGIARASTGSAAHLTRQAPDGRIQEWPVVELSIFDAEGARKPANAYAVALPVMKAVWQRAGMDLPDDIDEPATHEAGPEESVAADSAPAEEPLRTDRIANIGETEMSSVAADSAPAEEPLRTDRIANMGETEMSEVDIEQQVQEAVKAALEEERAHQEAERTRQEEVEGAKAEAVAAAKADWERQQATKNRLPMYDAPYVTKYNDHKYDHLDASDMAVMIGVLKTSGKPVSDLAYKSLALKCQEAKDHEPSQIAIKALYRTAGRALKADEIMQQDLSGYGDDWVGVQYSNQLWEKIRQDSWVVDRLSKVEVPAGHESIVIPLESTDPTFYKVSEAADTATSGWPNTTITSSQMGTANRTLPLVKMGARVLWSGELEEDSLIQFVPQLRAQLQRAGAEQLEHVIIDGDTTTSATTNINDIGGTPGGGESFLLVDGFRKLPLVTNTANSRDAGTLTEADYLETVKLLGGAGKNALSKDRVTLIPDLNTYWKSLDLAALKTEDVWKQATLRDGVLERLWGFQVKPSAFMHYDPSGTVTGAYELKANSAGKIDLDTTTNNAYGAILAVRWDQWLFGWRRRMTLETTRIARADTTEIVALMRFGLIYRDTEASAISYNVTV